MRILTLLRLPSIWLLLFIPSTLFAQAQIDAIVNGASFSSGKVTNGSIATIFGHNLAAGPVPAQVVPLPRTLGNTSVLVNGNPVPLWYVSPTQINFQIPYSTGGTVSVAVKSGTASSAPVMLPLQAAAPGIFLDSQGRAIVQNASDGYSLNGPGRPAAAGTTVVAYLTGLGAVDNPGPDGVPAPNSPLARAMQQYSATIGGVLATVDFLGLVPGSIGLAQANIRVPNLPAGDYPLTISVGGVISNAAAMSIGPVGQPPGPPAVTSPYFGFHVSPTTYSGGYPWPSVSIGSMRLWDTATKWADMNPAAGTFDFSQLDSEVSKLAAENVSDTVLALGGTPHWISSNPNNQNCQYVPENGPGLCEPPQDLNPDGSGTDQAWKDFITALAKHVNGRIKYFELWNEPSDPEQWHGTIAQLARMAKDASAILKSVDPQAKLTTGTPVANRYFTLDGWMDQFLAAGTASVVDIITFHGYVGENPPENLVDMILNLRATAAAHGVSNLPLWDTEGSWGLNTDLPDIDVQAAYLARLYLLQTGEGVARFYWYRWDSAARGTLWTPAGGILKPGIAYRQVESWIAAAKPNGSCTQTGSVWTCGFTNGLAVWNTSMSCANGACQTVNYTPPATYTHYLTLDGMSVPINPGAPVPIGAKPIFLQ
jgi:polysaccharide biosynthesis protein PslG